MNISLGLNDYIDNSFQEWLKYPDAIKLVLIQSDIDAYSSIKFDKSNDRNRSLSPKKLVELLKDFSDVDTNNKEALKKIYSLFIEKVCKPDNKITTERNKDSEEQNENYSTADEYKAITAMQATAEMDIVATEYLEEKSAQLEALIQAARLSDVEKYAIDFLKSKKIEKHPLLNNFTLNGIIQIANRGAYKLYYFNRIISS